MAKNNDNDEKKIPIEIDKIESVKGPKKIDIYNHLKIGIQNSKKNCGCDHVIGQEPNEYYCIPCKISCCPDCTLSDHQKHLLIKKSKYIINKNNINLMYEPIDYVLENNSLFTDSTLVMLIIN